MVDFRFDGEELILFIEKNTTLEELTMVLEEKIKHLLDLVDGGTKISVWFEEGIEQMDCINYVGEKLRAARIPLKAFFFEKPSQKKVTSTPCPQSQPTQLSISPKASEFSPIPEHHQKVSSKIEVIEGSIRSGQRIEHTGNLLILGNVHNGSEISCTGNVIVYGEILGAVKAGTEDPEHSFVVSNQLNCAFIQIGEVFSNSHVSDTPSLCVLKNGRIHLIPIVNTEIAKDFWKKGKGEIV